MHPIFDPRTKHEARTMVQNQKKANERWGTNPYAKTSNTFRFIHQNVNGIPYSRDGYHIGLLLYYADKLSADVFSFVETNLEWAMPEVGTMLRDIASITYGQIRTAPATSSIRFKQQWKPGGVLLRSGSKITGNIIPQNLDPFGCWSRMQYCGRNDISIPIIAAYRAPNTSKPGPFTSWFQQKAQMMTTKNHNAAMSLRMAFIEDLIKFITNIQAEGDEILIGMDGNTVIGKDQMGIDRVMRECELFDLFGKVTETKEPLGRFNRSDKRIDYFLGSIHILDCVIGGGTIPFGECFSSDHRFIFTDLNLDILFGSKHEIPTFKKREFTTKFPKQTMKYKKELDRLFHERGIWNRIAQLNNLPPEKQAAQQIINLLDDEMTRCMIFAAKKSGRHRPHWKPWTPEVWKTGLLCILWRLQESSKKLGETIQSNSKCFNAHLSMMMK